jgi:hypothetical protein
MKPLNLINVITFLILIQYVSTASKKGVMVLISPFFITTPHLLSAFLGWKPLRQCIGRKTLVPLEENSYHIILELCTFSDSLFGVFEGTFAFLHCVLVANDMDNDLFSLLLFLSWDLQ